MRETLPLPPPPFPFPSPPLLFSLSSLLLPSTPPLPLDVGPFKSNYGAWVSAVIWCILALKFDWWQRWLKFLRFSWQRTRENSPFAQFTKCSEHFLHVNCAKVGTAQSYAFLFCVNN